MEKAPLNSEIAGGPRDGAAYWVATSDGLRLRVAHWAAETKPLGTVFLFPGRTEYIELQGRTAKVFSGAGYAALTIDWRGHGLSDRLLEDPETLHISQYADYQKDVETLLAVAEKRELPKPWFLVGNSMGGCIGLRALVKGLPVQACAFTAPMWSINMSGFNKLIALPLSFMATVLGKGSAYIPGHDGNNYVLNNPFEGNRITNDADGYDYWHQQACVAPELQTAGSSFRWLNQSLRECRRLSRVASPNLPSISFCGDNDAIVDPEAIRSRMQTWEDASFEIIPGAKHGLLLEAPDVRTRVIGKTLELFSQT